MKHVCSLRRNIYILPTDANVEIQEHITVNISGVIHHIYLSSGGIMCYNCKTKGHKASECTVRKPNNNVTTDLHRKIDKETEHLENP